jgi:hypothetical protein
MIFFSEFFFFADFFKKTAKKVSMFYEFFRLGHINRLNMMYNGV